MEYEYVSESKDLEKQLFKRLDEIYAKILKPQGITGEEYARMAAGPITCAIRLVMNRGIDKIWSVEYDISIAAAAKIAYLAFSIDEDIKFWPSNSHWLSYLGLWDVPINKKMFDEITINMLKNQDMCVNERFQFQQDL